MTITDERPSVRGADGAPWHGAEQRQAIQDFWRVHEAHFTEISGIVREWERTHGGLVPVFQSPADARFGDDAQLMRGLREEAAGAWLAYRTSLELRGAAYAEVGVSLGASCATPRFFMRNLVPRLVESYAGEPNRLVAAIQVLNEFGDYTVDAIATGYLERKDSIIRSREEDLATMLDSIGDAVVVTDADGCVVRMNPVAERLTGFAFFECRGTPLDRIFRIEHEETGQPVESPVARVLREGVVVGLANHTVLVARDGKRCPIADSGAPVRRDDGEVRGVVLVFRDVTEERRAEEALRHWERIFQHATWGVALASTHDVCFRAVNPAYAEMHGYRVDELLGKPVSMLWAEETRSDMEKHAHETHQYGRLVVETTHLRKDGTRLPVEVVATTIKNAQGKVAWFVANVQDITERKRLHRSQVRAIELEADNRRIEEANRLKSEFLANMSHELRTPLNSIIGFAQLLHDGEVGTVAARQKEFLGDILTSGLHLLRLINDVLDLAKVEAGKMDFRVEQADLAVLIKGVVQSLRAAALHKRIDVEVSADPRVDDVILDPGRFKQILYNYLSNALKFTPDEGRVTVRVLPEGGTCFRLEVEDTGPGVPEGEVHRLFTPFQQLDASATKRHGGTGLGLALTKRLAEAQGGSVGMVPAPDHGSIFFAVLPRRPTGVVESLSPRADVQPVSREPSSQPVLVVDDDPASLKLMGVTLARLGYEAACFSNGISALDAVAQVRPVAVIIDLLMPSMDGFAFLERFRALPEHRRVPVMIWTVKDLSPDEQRNLLASADAVVRKGGEADPPLSAALQAFLPAVEDAK